MSDNYGTMIQKCNVSFELPYAINQNYKIVSLRDAFHVSSNLPPTISKIVVREKVVINMGCGLCSDILLKQE